MAAESYEKRSRVTNNQLPMYASSQSVMFGIALLVTLQLKILTRDWHRLPLPSFFYYPLPNTSVGVGPASLSGHPIYAKRPFRRGIITRGLA
jgi:hypothetical protein